MASPTNLLLQYQHSELVASKSITSYPHDQIEEQDTEACQLEERLMALESEHKKIDAFKRELPLCMQLLHDAIEASKEQLALYRSSSQMQLQRLFSCNFDNKVSNVQSDSNGYEPITLRKPPDSFYADSNEGEQAGKSLCTQAVEDAFHWMKRYQSVVSSEERCPWYMQEQVFSSSAKPVFGSKQKLGGAFLPFSRDSRLVQPTPRPGAINPADLALKCPDSEIIGPPNQVILMKSDVAKSWESVQQQPKSSAMLDLSIRTKSEANSKEKAKGTIPEEKKVENDASAGNQPTRKARRSWSPDLHRLFLDTLHKLGGAQATPKQIRELMKIEGLTNDEVKSHLQKYRLHARRLGSSPASSSQVPDVDPVGGARVSSEFAQHSGGVAVSVSYNTSRQSQSCETSVTQNCSDPMHSQISPCCAKRSTSLLQPEHLWQGPVQLMGHPTAGYFRVCDVVGEESVGEAAKSENSLSKGHQAGLWVHESNGVEDHSSSGIQTHSCSEDDVESEDSKDWSEI
eukprot:c13857_g1_i1 orf=417-1958(+)